MVVETVKPGRNEQLVISRQVGNGFVEVVDAAGCFLGTSFWEGVAEYQLGSPLVGADAVDGCVDGDEAKATAEQMSTTNEWGMEDSFYTDQLEPVLADLKDSRAGETYTDTPEYDDLDCFLDIADACGIEVLVVLSPEMGPYYDHIGIDAKTRAGCYDRVRSVVAGHASAELADFTSHEYEKYFLYDIVHFGWTGWIDVEEAIYRFAKGGA